MPRLRRPHLLLLVLALTIIASIIALRAAPAPTSGVVHGHTLALHPAIVLIECFIDGRTAEPRVGFIVEPGHLITNRHCIEGAARARIRMPDRSTIPVRGIIAEDAQVDLAILELDLSDQQRAALPALRFSEDPAAPGDPVWIVHRHFRTGQAERAAGRIISIDDSPWHGADIVASAPGDFGFSGSPLVNNRGEVVGIVRAGEIGTNGKSRSSSVPASIAVALPRTAPIPLDDWWAQYDRSGWARGRGELQWAYWHASRGNRELAEQHARAALGHDPLQAGSWIVLMRLHSEAGEYPEAIECMRHWLAIEPENASAWRLLASKFVRNGQLEEAVEAYRQCIDISPSPDASATFWLAMTLGRLGRKDEELEALERTLQIDPDHADARFYLGAAHHRADRHDEALNAYEAAAKLDTADERAPYWAAMVHMDRREYDQAEVWLRKAIEADPESHASYCALARLLGMSDRIEEANHFFSEAILRRSDCRTTILGLAHCARARGEARAAREWTDRLIAIEGLGSLALPLELEDLRACAP